MRGQEATNSQMVYSDTPATQAMREFPMILSIPFAVSDKAGIGCFYQMKRYFFRPRSQPRMASEVLSHYSSGSHIETVEGGIPAICITPSRRVSISSPLRFTRTFSQDSIDSLERNGRVELRRLRIMNDYEESPRDPQSSLSPSACPHLKAMGRSVTEPHEVPKRALTRAPRSVGDLSRAAMAPPKKTLAETVGLTSYQQRLIQQCWPNIYSTGPGGAFANSIYTQLTARNANARKLLAKANGVAVFAQNDMDCTAMHARATVEILDTAVRGLEADCSRFVQNLTEIGKSHRHLRAEGLNTATWDELGDVMVECLRRSDMVRKHKELRRAWLAITAFIIESIKQGQSMARASSSYDLNSSPK